MLSISISWSEIPGIIDVLLTSDSLFVRNNLNCFHFMLVAFVCEPEDGFA